VGRDEEGIDGVLKLRLQITMTAWSRSKDLHWHIWRCKVDEALKLSFRETASEGIGSSSVSGSALQISAAPQRTWPWWISDFWIIEYGGGRCGDQCFGESLAGQTGRSEKSCFAGERSDASLGSSDGTGPTNQTSSVRAIQSHHYYNPVINENSHGGLVADQQR
jgi:hypothetical protein